MLSGAVEPVGAFVTILLAAWLLPVLPYLLAFAAGRDDLCGRGGTGAGSVEGEHSNIGTIAFAAGFVLMMVLDVALG